VSWQVPANSGYSGAFTPDEKLKAIKTLSIGDNFGPEDIALDAQGRIYASTHAGNIVRLDADGSNAKNWINTGGRPLGIDFDHKGNLIIADAFLGLLSVSPEGKNNRTNNHG
jgi:sugar lactone lactonase YvrE